jgi:sialic acid synthase SpsE
MRIAEIGLNHRGDFKLAKKYVSDLLQTDIDAITFQIRENGFYVGDHKHHELTLKQYKYLKEMVHSAYRGFGLAICNPDVNKYPEPDFIKILSKDLDNLDFLSEMATRFSDKPMHLSTGLASFKAIDNALNKISQVRDMSQVRIIHTRLSNSIEDVNLKAILSMKERFGNIVAFGNHCKNYNVILASASYEPTDFYFYVKHRGSPWNKHSAHPDDLHAVCLNEVQDLCRNINDIQMSLGSGNKTDTFNNIEGQR